MRFILVRISRDILPKNGGAITKALLSTVLSIRFLKLFFVPDALFSILHATSNFTMQNFILLYTVDTNRNEMTKTKNLLITCWNKHDKDK